MRSPEDEGEDPRIAADTGQASQVFTALLAMINTESQLVWNRYNAMLTANAFVAVLLGAVFAAGNWSLARAILVVIICFFGLTLSWQWKRLTSRGWELEHIWVKYAERFEWVGFTNPLLIYAEWTKKREGTKDWISAYAQRVIWIFIIGYLLTAAVALLIAVIPFSVWQAITVSL